MGAFGRTAAEYGARQQTHKEETRSPALHDARASGRAWRRRTRRGCGGSAAGGSADWVARRHPPSPPESQLGGAIAPPGLPAHPKEHAESVDHVGLDSRRDGAVRPAGLTRAPGMGRRRGLGRGDTGAVGHRWPVGRSGRRLHRRRRLGWAGPHRPSGVPALPARARSGVAGVLAGSAAYGVRDRSGHVRAPGRSPHRRRRSGRPAHPREGGQDQHRRARPDQTGPGHDRADRLPRHRGPDQSGCGGLRDPGGPHASPGTLRRRTHEGPQRRAHHTAGQDLGTPCAIPHRSRNPPVRDTKPR